MKEVLRAEDLVKVYGDRAVVNGVSLKVHAGEIVGLLGPNGAGKTTTFQMIVGMVRPTRGEILLGEEPVGGMPMYRRARRGIGYLPQEESIFRRMTVEDNLMAILETLPLSDEEQQQRCDDLLSELGVDHIRKNKAFTLSGGEKRRLTIARCLATEPSILLLDEPFSGVDPIAVQDIQQIVRLLSRKGLAVLITDHNVRETLSVVHRAYLICEGKVESQGTSEFLVNDPIARELYLGARFNM
ncbi:MAG: LPS export ABC transporter ATP-binding protein [Candidatus Methylacidiphilales bacterium]